MLHILLIILKMIGIVLLFLLLSVLFIPVRYRVKGYKDETDLAGNVRIFWLLGLIVFVTTYQEKTMNLQLKLFGIDFLKLLKKNKKRKKTMKKTSDSKRKNVDKSEKIEDNKENKEAIKKPIVQEHTLYTQSESPKKTIYEKIKLTIKNICDKISYWKKKFSDERNKAAILLVKDHLIKIIKHVLPKKLKGNIVYGFEDPCTTGQVLAGVSIVYPAYYKYLSISPDFSGAVFTGNIDLKGRIYIVYLLKSVLMIFLNKNIQYIIHTFRNKEES